LSDTGRSDWCKNLLADPHVTLEIAGERRETLARPVEGSDPADRVMRSAMLAKYQSVGGDDLRAWAETAWLVRVDWPR
jgi:hypothetical protein